MERGGWTAFQGSISLFLFFLISVNLTKIHINITTYYPKSFLLVKKNLNFVF